MRVGRDNLRRFGVAVAIGAVMLTQACGGDDDGASEPAAGSDQAVDAMVDEDGPADDIEGGSATTEGSCAGLSVNGTSPGNDAFTATSAAAVSLEGGRAYTMYLADFDLSVDDISMFSTPTVPEGGTMFTVAVTVFNAPDVEAFDPLSPGVVIEYTSEFEVLTFVVTARDGDEIHGRSTGAEGTLEVTGTGGTFCGTVTYTDGEKTLTGTFESPVKAL